MWAKVFTAVVLFIICSVLNVYWNSIIQPEGFTELALQQLSSSNAVAQQIRVYQHAQNYPTMIIWSIYIINLIFIFLSEIWQLVASLINSLKRYLVSTSNKIN